MFWKHVNKDLSAYCNGELSAAESRRVAEHLIGCKRCHADYELVKLGVKLAESLPHFFAPDSLWNDLEARIESAPQINKFRDRSSRSASGLWHPRWAAAAASVVLLLGLGGFWFYSRESRPFWEVLRLDGQPQIGSSFINQKGRLAVGQWLVTDSESRAKIEVGSIGQVEIDPNTRVRLLETKPTEHRLELARGRMSAQIWAPPRLFFVDTPSAVAADLGCAYTLEVDDEGGSLLHVTSGWVALELKDRESIVPAGAACATRPGIGPGTPYFEDASESFRIALRELDFGKRSDGGASALQSLLVAARPRDTLTLWHLLARVEGRDREHVYERMVALVPPPNDCTRDGVLRLDQAMLLLWKDKLENSWYEVPPSGLKKTLNKLWGKGLGKINGLEGKK